MGKSTPQAPKAPDPVATANAQAAANSQAAITQANLNRIDQVTPQGSITYNQIGTNSDGTPRYQQVQSYSPQQQALYDQQNQIAQSLGGLAQNNVQRVQQAQNSPLSFDSMTALQSSVPGATYNPGNFNATVQRAEDAAYGKAASRLDPQFAQQESDMRARLAASGISENSDAYRREVDNFSRNRNDAYDVARNSAFGAGLAAQDQGYQQGLSTAGFNFNSGAANATLNNQVRQQQIDEASYLRNLPLNDIAALLGTGGGVQNPNFSNFAQVGVAAPDYQGAVYANYNAANAQYQQAQNARGQGLGSIFGLAGTLGAAAISDMRFKLNIRRIGTLANGLATYVYNYVGSKAQQFGVMAQEALNIVPEAVGVTRDGVLYVDYRKVW